jgi:hypothetical protein
MKSTSKKPKAQARKTYEEPLRSAEYHATEAVRIAGVLKDLKGDTRYAPNGVVRTVLRWRAEQERQRALDLGYTFDEDT